MNGPQPTAVTSSQESPSPGTPAYPRDTAVEALCLALAEKLQYLTEGELVRVREACQFACDAHAGQTRRSGEPYITHPIAVASQCAEWKLDAQAIMAALLHDVIEDCAVNKTVLQSRFGSPVAAMVDGLTKLDKLKFSTREENQAESFRKMLFAMGRDVRVILIKLADRMHNMQTLANLSREGQVRIATETLEIYAPIAHRLGLNQTYLDLQDLAFRYLLPWRYTVLSKALQRAHKRNRNLFRTVQSTLERAFHTHGMKVEITGRRKSLYSIYRKMCEKNLSFAHVTDIFGFRIQVPGLLDCYTALGLLHQIYKPIPGRFKDYIAICKSNGYQSLHTTVIGPSGTSIEFQLRTEAMHLVAQSGVASHWMYKKQRGFDPKGQTEWAWLQSLLEVGEAVQDSVEFWEHIKVGLFTDAIYVFTPQGKIHALPRGATVLDFAYAVHSDLGNHAAYGVIDNATVSLSTELRNGNTVHIHRDSSVTPNPSWLEFVHTPKARTKIRQHLKTLHPPELQTLGQRLLLWALRSEGFDNVPGEQGSAASVWDKLLRFSGTRSSTELLAEIGSGRRLAHVIAKRLAKLLVDSGHAPNPSLLSVEPPPTQEEVNSGMVTINGGESTAVRYATCCRPIPGDDILGYLGRGESLTIHICGCNVAQKLQHRNRDRFIPVQWGPKPVRSFETEIIVTVGNGKGVFAKVAACLSAAQADIHRVNMPDASVRGPTRIHFIVGVRDRKQLETVLHRLHNEPCVSSARRGHSQPPPSAEQSDTLTY
ncbi:RelA/SpoT family protein [Candidatus Symbiobacter mobilis]|uniref:GTP pyrophosphokinase n=1 Tax=Candidatus Symbiobacter mobilis CR TaxID=946483 RepID=U5N695_9BURK|nr:bifunctional (p)ppGpp synthetase/guanosine-3',5'-bis(diphosphate) 3'-pyrophosphohydrolase [Candidatus Symbiobacter mobilis]AGX86877.1 GTP pyrophosphokinase [Candidatus Symbiobacter mobilis CR]